MSTVEETREDGDNSCGRHAGCWGWKTRKAGRDGDRQAWRRRCGITGTSTMYIQEIRERSERERDMDGGDEAVEKTQ